ncbi:death-associated protein-like 1 isoform X2 [Corvus kubaryi]|uniref:death-associated protein-like 1 isoform X2 n=2 Tax=Corvus kubaryi TaxID=68294 RepID=UPI001C05D527|nr:death-associated protein-like 1 isoform X2 [Corvus kubaryi]
MALRRGVPPGRRLPAVKAGGMRVSKKQESGPVEKNAKPPGKEKSSAIVSFPQPQNMGVLVAEVLNKFPCVGTITYFPEMNHRDDRMYLFSLFLSGMHKSANHFMHSNLCPAYKPQKSWWLLKASRQHKEQRYPEGPV